MSILSFNPSILPEKLKEYAEGKIHSIVEGHLYTKEEIHVARMLRRITLRKFTNANPGLQWSRFPDFGEIMGNEIIKFGDTILQKKQWVTNTEAWNTLCEHCPRLSFMYNAYGGSLTKDKHKLQDIRYRVWKIALFDPRLLGEIEEYVLGHIRFGIKTQTNRYHPTQQ